MSKLIKVLPLLIAFAGPARADTSVQVLMRNKLTAAHGLLEGVVTQDYSKIEHFAGQLREIGRATTWHRVDEPDFLTFAKSFQNSAEFLGEQARNKDIEGVSMGYIRLTLDCIRCHNSLRPRKTKP